MTKAYPFQDDTVFTAGRDGTVRAWAVKTGRLRHVLGSRSAQIDGEVTIESRIRVTNPTDQTLAGSRWRADTYFNRLHAVSCVPLCGP